MPQTRKHDEPLNTLPGAITTWGRYSLEGAGRPLAAVPEAAGQLPGAADGPRREAAPGVAAAHHQGLARADRGPGAVWRRPAKPKQTMKGMGNKHVRSLQIRVKRM
jgi:hypothetical protein